MKLDWNDKMRKIEEGNLKKVEDNHVSNTMYTDLENLKKGGPFTKAKEVMEFDENTTETKEKNERLYTEIRYAKKFLFVNETYCICISFETR